MSGPSEQPDEMVWHHVFCTVCGEDRSTNVETGEQFPTIYRAPRSDVERIARATCGTCGGPMTTEFLSGRDALTPWQCEGGPYHGREITRVEPGTRKLRLPVRSGISPHIRPVDETVYDVDWVNRVLRWNPE